MTTTDLPTIRICDSLTLPFWNPPRLQHLPSPGTSHARYVIGWQDGIVKIGLTHNGRRRWGMALARGGTMLDLAYYDSPSYPLQAEVWLREMMAQKDYQQAFHSRDEAEPYLGNGGSGYTECLRIPVPEWGELIRLAKEETRALVQR